MGRDPLPAVIQAPGAFHPGLCLLLCLSFLLGRRRNGPGGECQDGQREAFPRAAALGSGKPGSSGSKMQSRGPLTAGQAGRPDLLGCHEETQVDLGSSQLVSAVSSTPSLKRWQ